MYFQNPLFVAAAIINVVFSKKNSQKQDATALNRDLINWGPEKEKVS